MHTKHTVILADSRDMSEVPDASVHLLITSPPYWQLKDYGDDSQIGYNDTYEQYINNLNLVWSEVFRVLQQGCRLCVNIGDQFARSVYYGRYKIIPIRTEIIRFCETVGLDYMGAIIWQKLTTTNTTGGATIMGSFPFPRNGILKLDYEFILVFRKPGKPPAVSKERKERSRLTTEEWNTYFAGHWVFPGEKQRAHLAAFPDELPRRLIKMFSFVGDTVLDPFLGSGTTARAARHLRRNSIGYELNRDFLPIIRKKLGVDTVDLFEECDFEFLDRATKAVEVERRIEKLPYRFIDPVRFDKTTDPKKQQFGSRIDSSFAPRESYETVIEVLSPERVLFGNGVLVRLLGIKERLETREEAIALLSKMILGKRVFLRREDKVHSCGDELIGYLYLKNRTFINARLIKSSLVDIDTTMDYRHKARFLKYASE